MSAFHLAWRHVAARPALNLLTMLSVAVGLGLVIAVMALASATRTTALQGAGGYQLLVAAKGSPTQAVLSTMFFMEPPTGNIPTALYRELQADPGLERVVPFSLGDSYRGHYIVATSPAYPAMLAAGTGRPVRTEPAGRWAEQPFEAVLGATVARETGLRPGDGFDAAHGFIDLPPDLAQEHAGEPYRVVAVLERTGTPADRAIFTPLETAWQLHAGPGHGHAADEQITALLLEARGYADLARLAGALARRDDVQAVFPGRVVTRLLGYLRVGEGVMLGVAWLAIGIAVIAVMISILAAAIERRRQIATMRAIGASRGAVVRMLAAEAALVAGLGAAGGLVLGRIAAMLIAVEVERSSGLRLELPPPGLADLGAVAATLLLGMLAGALPAVIASREDVARNLAQVT